MSEILVKPRVDELPDYTDDTDNSVLYKGYKRGSGVLVTKVVVAAPLTTMTLGKGAWADRATLDYA